MFEGLGGLGVRGLEGPKSLRLGLRRRINEILLGGSYYSAPQLKPGVLLRKDLTAVRENTSPPRQK